MLEDYRRRESANLLRRLVNNFSAILVTGARQVGKTTLLKEEFPKAHYLSFDDPAERSFAINDPLGFLNRFNNQQVILDEVQYVPEIFTYLKLLIDQNPRAKGRFLLTGSQQFQMMRHLSESLAGRVGIMELHGFNTLETDQLNLEEKLWRGSFPDPLLHQDEVTLWFRSYLQTYIERDVRQLQNIKDLRKFQDFIQLAAAVHAQELNYANLATEIGMSQPLIKDWINLLSTSYLTFLLEPFHKNFGKRLTKRPKFYFWDSGLVSFLTRHQNAAQILSGPMAGAFFEGFVIAELKRIASTVEQRVNFYYWRSHDGLELDLIIEIQNFLMPIEIKKTATPTLEQVKNLQKFIDLFGEKNKLLTPILVCNTTKTQPLSSQINAMNINDFLLLFKEKIQ